MTIHVEVRREKRRGCGYRKPSKSGVGIYLVADGLSAPCGLLPFLLEICPCCGGGIKATRGWTWIEPSLLFGSVQPLRALAGEGEPECELATLRLERDFQGNRWPLGEASPCRTCPMGSPPKGKHGLLWVGGGFYTRPEDFTREAQRMGVSRKIQAIPRGFELGTTWVYLAHRTAIWDKASEKMLPGIFSAFKPRAIDLVIDDPNSVPARVESIVEQFGEANVNVIKVIPEDYDAQQDLFDGAAQ